jgi:hypothetical protein
LNGLRWRFSGRDHHSLSQLDLFRTLHKSEKLRQHWGKEVATDFDKSAQPSLKFKVDVREEAVIKQCQQLFDTFDGNKSGKLTYA